MTDSTEKQTLKRAITQVVPSLSLNDESSVPIIGFGTGTAWSRNKLPSQDLIARLKLAFQLGIRHIDCAESYGTEREVGIAIQESGVAREELFITTKVGSGIKDIPGALNQSLAKLKLEYVDLYLIHQPYFTENKDGLKSAWQEMEKVKASGKTKSIGISNFLRHHIETILDGATVVPAVNQIEFHPYLQRANNFLPWMREKGIAVSCFKGLAPLTIAKGGPLDSVIEKIAKTHDVPQAAVLLKWHLSQDVIAITTTSKEERLLEYLKAISLMLSAEELDEITKIGLTHHFRQQGAQRFAPDDRS